MEDPPGRIRQKPKGNNGTIGAGVREMKTFAKDMLVSFVLGVVLPAVILSVFLKAGNQTPSTVPEATTLAALQPESVIRERLWIPVLMESGAQIQMDLEEYLRGVVLAEMPVDFELEALKAQAVVSRTYALRRLTVGTKHTEGTVCTDSSCCQGYLSEEEYRSKGGTVDDVIKVSQAVQATAGEVLVYQGDLIDATYFSCSGGRTEDAQAVWGSDVAYLQAVDSPGEESAAYHTDEAVYTAEQVEMALSVELVGDPEDWFNILSLTEGNSVGKIDICGNTFTGVEVRKALGLRSAAFSVEADQNTVTFYTKGYGHRVGMSQYGADAMAVAGSNYDKILAHYYQGTELVQYQLGD